MKKHSILFCLLVILLISKTASAQNSGGWSTTWNNPTSSLASVMVQGYINKKMLQRSIANDKAGKARSSTPARPRSSPSLTARTRSQSAGPNNAVLIFRPVANSGVAKQTADALGSSAQERLALLNIFQRIKKSYEVEVAKEGKSNNIAAALTFFMASASMAYHQTEEPSDNITNALFEVLKDEMSAAPNFKRMTNLEKQKMHDWLVVSGGFLLAGYIDATQNSDQQQLADYKALANEFFKLVLGTGVEQFDLVAIGLMLEQ